ncbi:MAG: hypothetical protein NW206_11200 [Hyphomonadaceae bacterium]|nr:hypothetical protein [Hyphomonadaceae bacterium]
MDVEILIPLSFFAFLGAVIIVPIMMKERTKRSAHDLVGKAIERGQTLDADLVAQLTNSMLEEGNRARKSLGNGVILLALTGGFVAASAFAGDLGRGGEHGLLYPAIILGFIGLGFIGLSIFDYATKRRPA